MNPNAETVKAALDNPVPIYTVLGIVLVPVTLVAMWFLWYKFLRAAKECKSCNYPEENKRLKKESEDNYKLFLNSIGNLEVSVDITKETRVMLEETNTKLDETRRELEESRRENKELFNQLLTKSEKQNEVLIKLSTTLDLQMQYMMSKLK